MTVLRVIAVDEVLKIIQLERSRLQREMFVGVQAKNHTSLMCTLPSLCMASTNQAPTVAFPFGRKLIKLNTAQPPLSY
jgi:hypothetical protein